MVLKTLDIMGPQHRVSHDLLHLNDGTVYALLPRLRHQGWIAASWGRSESDRRARFYAITGAGRWRLAAAHHRQGLMVPGTAAEGVTRARP